MIIKRIDNGIFADNAGHVFSIDNTTNLPGVQLLTRDNGRRYILDQIDGKYTAKQLTKKFVYACFGIKLVNGKIYHAEFGYIMPLLVNGNKKIGVGCYHFSVLPGTGLYEFIHNGKLYTVRGTCACDCIGCYAKTGNYNFPSVKKSLGIKTWLINNDLDFVYRAISAQLIADNIKYCRIHAAGDFNKSIKYAFTWLKIAVNNSRVKFWTYTKIKQFETLFDGVQNANIVKSVIDGIGINYGHCDYIMATYDKLIAAGKKVHICRCGIDPDQHCINCKGCSANEYVLFIEHSTEYVAAKDPNFAACAAMIENQESEIIAAA